MNFFVHIAEPCCLHLLCSVFAQVPNLLTKINRRLTAAYAKFLQDRSADAPEPGLPVSSNSNGGTDGSSTADAATSTGASTPSVPPIAGAAGAGSGTVSAPADAAGQGGSSTDTAAGTASSAGGSTGLPPLGRPAPGRSTGRSGSSSSINSKSSDGSVTDPSSCRIFGCGAKCRNRCPAGELCSVDADCASRACIVYPRQFRGLGRDELRCGCPDGLFLSLENPSWGNASNPCLSQVQVVSCGCFLWCSHLELGCLRSDSCASLAGKPDCCALLASMVMADNVGAPRQALGRL